MPQEEIKKEYKGFMKIKSYGENDDALFLSDNLKYPLCERIMDDMMEEGQFLTVRYFISDKEKTLDELTENLIKKISGSSDVDYNDCYSDITGYLWTDEDLKVGGHDLLGELRENEGKFVFLEIIFHKEPPIKPERPNFALKYH